MFPQPIRDTSSARPSRAAIALLMFTLTTMSSLVSAQATTGGAYPTASWETSTPEHLGWSAERLDAALDYARKIGSDALLVVVDGVVVAELGDPSQRFQVRSIRKPLLGSLLGIEISAQRLALDASLEELGIEEKGGLSTLERQATVADLLTSRSGVYARAAWEHPSHAASRPQRDSHEPGTHFYYNNWDFNALGTIYRKVTGTDIYSSFLERIARPLAMQDYRVEDGDDVLESHSLHPAYRFQMSARDLARFGLLFLREGRWMDQQILTQDWVRESTRTHVDQATEFSGYGYLWRTYPKYGSHYAATGAGSQMLVISPQQQLVVVHLKATAPGMPGIDRSKFWRLFGMIAAAEETQTAH